MEVSVHIMNTCEDQHVLMNCAYTNKLSQIIATVSSIAQESLDGDFVFNDRARTSTTTSMNE